MRHQSTNLPLMVNIMATTDFPSSLSSSFINNEALCTLQFFYSKLPKNDLVAILSEFYTADEITVAKNALFAAAKGACPDNVQQPVSCRGTNKRYADMDDTVTLFAIMDAKQVSLPTFTAVNLTRIPTIPCSMPAQVGNAVNPAVAALEVSVQDLHKQLDNVLVKLEEIKAGNAKAAVSLPLPPVAPRRVETGLPGANQLPAGASSSVSTVVETMKPTWADQAANLTMTSEPFRPSAVLRQKLLQGKRIESANVKAVLRLLACFVGRVWTARRQQRTYKHILRLLV